MAGSGFHFQYQGGGGGGGGDFELPPGLNGQVLTMVDEDTQTVAFEYITFPGTEDYYVSEGLGLDQPGRGSILAPFKTIQYAITQVPPNKNIIVRGGGYMFVGTEKLHYQGSITGENNAIIYVYINDGEYLIDNFTDVKIKGAFQLYIGRGRLLQNTTSYTLGVQEITAESIYDATDATNPIININNSAHMILRNISFSGDYVKEMFVNEDFAGAWFDLISCTFSYFILSFYNDAINGGTTVTDCNFYGTTDFSGKQHHIKIGNSNNTSRPSSFKRCYFDLVSLGLVSGQADAIHITAPTIFTLSDCTFGRRKTGVTTLYSDYNCTVGMRNTISAGLLNGGSGVIDEVNNNQFIYVDSTLSGLRF